MSKIIPFKRPQASETTVAVPLSTLHAMLDELARMKKTLDRIKSNLHRPQPWRCAPASTCPAPTDFASPRFPSTILVKRI